jgi:hypothetical protein
MTEIARVSVVIPTRNRLAHLQTTVRSVLGQQGVGLELIVVDEASDDGTRRWLDDLAAEDERVRVVGHDEPRGLPAARNAGIAGASSGWLAFCDDDDVWSPHKLAAQMEVARETGARWVTTGAVHVDPNLVIIGHRRVAADDVATQLRWWNPIPGGGSSVLVAASLLEESGSFDESLRASEDWDLWCRLSFHSPVGVVDRPLVGYRLWPATMSTDVHRLRTSAEIVRSRYGGDGGPPGGDLEQELFYAYQHVRKGRRVSSFRAYGRLALRYRSAGALTRAGAALLSPRAFQRVGQVAARRRLPAGWRAEAEGWLAPLRSLAN